MSSPKKSYYFIVNPVSGGRSKGEAVSAIQAIMDKKKVHYDMGWWDDHTQVSDLVKRGLDLGYDTLVAVGGDGTINQVARELVNTDHVLGILPFGSGNGFARHLGIKGHLEDHINILLKNHTQVIDTGTCNGQFFVNVAGVGFDAHVSHKFAGSKGRGLVNYAKVSIVEARNYPEESFELILDGEPMNETAFLISIANGSQWGNEFYIAPDAELNDGSLRCCMLKKPPLMAIPGLIRRFLTGDISQSKYYKDLPFRHLILKRKKPGPVHLDGEPALFPEHLEFQVHPASLRVISGK